MILHYKKYGILLAGILIAAALNIAGSLLSTRVNFPLYMDSFATIAAAAILGGAPAVLCALFTNGVLTLLGKLRLVFMVCQLMTAVFSWLIFSIERKRTESEILSFDSFMQAGIASAVSNGIFGSIFAAMLHYNLTAIEQGILAATGTVIFANLMGGLLLNLVDKAFAAFIAYGIYRIANKMLQRGSKPYPLAGGLPELSERMAFFSENKHHRHKGGIKPEYIFFVIALLTLILTFFFKHKTTQKFNEAYEAVISESGMSEKLLHVRAEEAFIHQGYYALAYTSFTLIMISFIIMQVRSGEQRKNLALSKVRENAQKAFSRDLHDGAAQSLSALKIALQAGETEKALRFVDSAIREVRELIGYLRIDLSTSFVQIVKRYAAIFQESYGIPVSVFEATACATSFTERTKHELVRIVKEALSNAAQHADATKIEIKLIDAGADFHITVRDNGKGFACAVNIDTAEIVTTSESVVLTDDAGNSAFSTPFARECVQENSPQPNIHIGLESMRERAESLGGTLSVHSGNDGTTICVSMPICAAISDNRGGGIIVTKVLVIDDHPGLRQSLVSALEKQTSGFAFLQAKDGTEAQSLLAQNADCRMLLLDVKLGVENGLAVLSELRQLRPDVRVLVYSAFAEPLQIVDAIRAGVQGYITKTAELSEIVEAVRAVADGKPSFCHEAQAVMQAMTDESMFNGGTAYSTSDDERHTLELFRRYRTLTPKEQQVFLLLARKYDVPDIAAALQKSVKTVENQRSAVYAKLGIHDRLGAVEAARVLGIGE